MRGPLALATLSVLAPAGAVAGDAWGGCAAPGGTVLAPTLDTALAPGRNVLWTRTPALRRTISFRHAFTAHAEPLALPGRTRAGAFGLPSWAQGVPGDLVAGQAVLHAPDREESARGLVPAPFLVTIDTVDPDATLYLASVGPSRSLREAWRRARGLVVAGVRRAFAPGGVLVVPRVRVDLRGPPGTDVRLLVDPASTGARSTEVAHLDPTRDAVRLLPPFLVALVPRGGDEPDVVLWVGNDELLEATRLRRAPPRTTRALAGEWIHDPDAMRARLREAWRTTPAWRTDPGPDEDLAARETVGLHADFPPRLVLDPAGNGFLAFGDGPRNAVTVFEDPGGLVLVVDDAQSPDAWYTRLSSEEGRLRLLLSLFVPTPGLVFRRP